MCIAVVQFLIPLVPNLVLIKMGLIYSYEHIRRALLDPFSSGYCNTVTNQLFWADTKAKAKADHCSRQRAIREHGVIAGTLYD